MSLTVVQRFYELAKQEAEAPALGLEYDGQFHELPWWFVKSKAKHFGLGLLENEAREGEYFYLLPSSHPYWIYAELGALTVGLQTLALPREISKGQIEDLFRRYPPAFFFLEAKDWTKWQGSFEKIRGLRRVLSVEDDSPFLQEGRGLVSSFRKVFNSGIRSESKHHSAYRRIRQSLEESRAMSPIRIDLLGHVDDRPLHFGEVNELCAKLSRALGPGKARRLVSAADLSVSFARVACLYWPIFSGMESIFLASEADLPAAFRRFRPEAGFLRETQDPAVEKIFGEPSGTPPSPGFFQRRALRRRLGKRLRCLVGETSFSSAFGSIAASLGLRLVAPEPSAANFLL